jgi:hypothetical protein
MDHAMMVRSERTSRVRGRRGTHRGGARLVFLQGYGCGLSFRGFRQVDRGTRPVNGRVVSSGQGVRVLHPGGNVALAVQYAPDIDVVRALDVEHEIGVRRQRPGA